VVAEVDGNAFADGEVMAYVLAVYNNAPLTLPEGRIYIAQACGRERDDRIWEGWLEFVPDDGSVVLRSQRETTQPNRTAIEYWASGLTPIYLKGALERTLTPPLAVVEPPVVPPVYDEPAPTQVPVNTGTREADPVLDPFSVYAKGEDLLRRQLAALSRRHLVTIIVAYELADESRVDLDALTVPELIELIADGVRWRLSA
jgi:hypothetical protein